MVTHSSIPAWEIPRTSSLVEYSFWGPQQSDFTEQQSLSELLYNIVLVSFSLFLFDSAILAGGK